MIMMNNQIKPNQNSVNKYTISGDSNIPDYPVAQNKQKDTATAIEEVTRSEERGTTEQRRAKEALKLVNPFKGV